MKLEKKIEITFDASAFQMLRKLLGITEYRCKYCNKKLNKNNVAGFTKDERLFCRNSFCIYKEITNKYKQSDNKR